MCPFSDFQYGFRSSQSTANLLTVVSDRIARACNRSGAIQAVALDISKAFDEIWHAGLLPKLKSYGISGQIFGLISSFLSNRQFQVVLDGKNSQEYWVNAGVCQGSILGPILLLLYINDLLNYVICNVIYNMYLLSVIYVDGTNLYSKCDQASDLWQQRPQNLGKIHEKYLWRSSFFKVASYKPATLLKVNFFTYIFQEF